MKKYFVLALILAALGFSAAYASDTTDQKIKDDSAQLKKDYQAKIDKELKVIGSRIAKLKDRTDANVSKDVKTQVKKLEEQKAEVDKKLAALGATTGDAWHDLTKGMDRSVHDLKRSVDRASDEFKPVATPVSK